MFYLPEWLARRLAPQVCAPHSHPHRLTLTRTRKSDVRGGGIVRTGRVVVGVGVVVVVGVVDGVGVGVVVVVVGVAAAIVAVVVAVLVGAVVAVGVLAGVGVEVAGRQGILGRTGSAVRRRGGGRRRAARGPGFQGLGVRD